jgi:glucosamine--fructose-6-phosphate aminotransferase (isomerizing)
LSTKVDQKEIQIKELAKTFDNKFNAIFLCRGTMHAISMEGAFKLMESATSMPMISSTRT